jgi:protein arginine kinase activator
MEPDKKNSPDILHGMECRLCNTDAATTRLLFSSGRDTVEIELCESCALDLGIATPGAGRVPCTADIYAVLLDPVYLPENGDDIVCPRCGCSLEMYRRTGVLGCRECYDVFYEFLDSSIRSAIHTGDVPDRLKPYRRIFVERETLLEELEAALSAERFEDAAVLRDRVRRIYQEGTHE